MIWSLYIGQGIFVCNNIFLIMKIDRFWERLVIALLLGIFSCHVFAKDYTVADVPNVRLTDQRNHVSNPDSILSPEVVGWINHLLVSLEDSMGIEVAVVALSGIGDEPPREFANELFNTWHIGKAGADNGLLIQMVTTPGKRTIVFETGYGIEDVLPDAICKRIQQRNMIPLLKKNDFNGGMVAGVEAVCKHLYEYGQVYKTPELELRPLTLTERKVLLVLALIGMAFAAYGMCWGFHAGLPRCPKCHKRGYKSRSYRTKMATLEEEGEYVTEYYCKHCGYTEKRAQKISCVRPYVDEYRETSSSQSRRRSYSGNTDDDDDWDSSSGSSSDSSGGSWGGGSSGGGGACSSF